ncbi:hypothetical protein BD410DRAFT_791731 [Rickenella mellea]|uniref:F-box domain-containing protein n=1 Tax=Rickenella mellea TaxID=50990 RepID=A0A4Y7PWR0_9AGAM|nr:hypothetical protein BD410DRAFT_791731 [Rickenella mellea]
MQPLETRSNAMQTLLIPDILSEIFIHCVPDGSLSVGQSSALSFAPLNLSRVCNRRRAVSLSTADLWAYVCVEGVLTRLPNKTLERVNVWIARSRSRPLSITLCIRHLSDSPHDMSKPHDPIFEEILSVALSQSSRWRNLQLFVPPQFKDILFSQLRTGNLSSLEEFTAEF